MSDKHEASKKVLEILKDFGMKEGELKHVEFFFYAGNENDASNLAIELSKLGYLVKSDNSVGENTKWCITGWTTKINMEEEPFMKWYEAMSLLAEESNCEFDGYGTFDGEFDPFEATNQE
ncbi:MAG: ribonuclease E inhibitor RraB [Bacteroidia bacterium]|nr:ribonuclease E inhibitor RraB [Bacteroidia bacterium]